MAWFVHKPSLWVSGCELKGEVVLHSLRETGGEGCPGGSPRVPDGCRLGSRSPGTRPLGLPSIWVQLLGTVTCGVSGVERWTASTPVKK